MNNQSINPFVEYDKLDKMSVDMYTLGFNTIMRLNVSLAKMVQDKRQSFYREYEYPSRYPGISSAISTQMTLDYYFSIETLAKEYSHGAKIFIQIRPEQYDAFYFAISTAIDWFTNSTKYPNLFARKGDEIFVTAPIPKVVVQQLPQNKYIEIIPIVIDRGASINDKEFGVRMFLGTNLVYVDMTLNKLKGLQHAISGNMFQMALTLLSTNPPPYGMNRTAFDLPRTYSTPATEQTPPTTGNNGRRVIPKGSKQNISDMED